MFSKIGIVGVGLIGSSFALALRKAGFDGSVLGVSSPPTIEAAIRCGVIEEGVTLERAAAECDLLYLAQPIVRIVAVLEKLGTTLLKKGILITDAGSTKRTIVRTAGRVLPPDVFVGGHPMAGKETRGPENADPDLFIDRTYFLTPSEKTANYEELVSWVRKIGSNPIEVDADAHDRMVSLTSHLAQLASTALAVTVDTELGPDQARIASGSGLRDMTRLALSDWEIWADIVATNTEQIDIALKSYIEQLQSIRTRLTSGTLQPAFGVGEKFAKSLRYTPK
ncbi:MAG: prephenate dehydrogenase/arogenate dehydrogenase family protein [Bryobacterales bacterium]|nr:prephenate dehydrogenase/arogenate dehydrogenase family protein [Bryobacterales bacterium]